MTTYQDGMGICLLLSERPAPRELTRVEAILRGMPDRTVRVVAPERARSRIPDRLAAETDFIWYDPAAGKRARGELESLGIAVAVCLSEPACPADVPDLGTRLGTWVILDCDTPSKHDSDAIRRSIAEGRRELDISIRPLTPSGPGDRVLAYCDRVPRRSWDSVAALQRRLDARIPGMIEEACERLARGDEIVTRRQNRAAAHSRPRKTNWRQRVTDIRYPVHLAGLAWSHLFRARKLRIVCFHDPCPDILDETLAALARTGPFFSYSEIARRIRDGLPLSPGFVVTFDDGYKQNVDLLDVLDKHGCKAMFFVSTASVDSPAPLWFMNREKRKPDTKEHLKSLDYQDFLAAIDEAGLTDPCRMRGRYGLRSEEIRTLLRRGHEIGIHTHNHPFMNRLKEDEIRLEITTCFDRLRRITGDDSLPLHVAYPDGAHNDRAVRTLDDMTADSAVILGYQPVAPTTHRLRIPRYALMDSDYPGVSVLKIGIR